MGYLLDTHSFLWFINGDKQLSRKARKCIEDPSIKKYIIIASLWEMAIKVNIGKLDLDMAFGELQQHIVRNGFELLPITFEHTVRLSSLGLHHRDPFDRIIIAQSLFEGCSIITKDKNFDLYNELKLIW